MPGWRGLLEWLSIFWPSPAVRACITLVDSLTTTLTLIDSLPTSVTLADSALATVALSDARCG